MIVSDTGFHVFGIEWGPKYINYYIDDVLYNHTSRCARRMGFDHPFYIVINLAVGGSL
jgi:beta-glucanase (GH16 family)